MNDGLITVALQCFEEGEEDAGSEHQLKVGFGFRILRSNATRSVVICSIEIIPTYSWFDKKLNGLVTLF